MELIQPVNCEFIGARFTRDGKKLYWFCEEHAQKLFDSDSNLRLLDPFNRGPATVGELIESFKDEDVEILTDEEFDKEIEQYHKGTEVN